MFGRAASLALRALSSGVAQQAIAPAAAVQGCLSASTSSVPAVTLARRAFATNSTDIFNTHKDTPDNNASTPFEISPVRLRLSSPSRRAPLRRSPHRLPLDAYLLQENMKKLDKIIARYPPNYKQSAVIPVLDVVQQMNGGWLSLNAMNKVAAILEMPEIRVYEVGMASRAVGPCIHGGVQCAWHVPGASMHQSRACPRLCHCTTYVCCCTSMLHACATPSHMASARGERGVSSVDPCIWIP